MGHEYAGIVNAVGSDVENIKPDQFVIGSFFASDNICEICQAGYQTSCIHRAPIGSEGAQAELLWVPLAASDVLGTGWFGAVASKAGPGKTVVVVSDGMVGLLAVLAARQLGAEWIIAMNRHELRQKLAREFGATDIITERGDAGVANIKEFQTGSAPAAWSRRSAPRNR